VPVDRLGDGRAAVPHQIADVLEPDIDLVPRYRPRLLGTDAEEQGQDHIGREPASTRLDGLEERDGLA
jgi:hypothetical protein